MHLAGATPTLAAEDERVAVLDAQQPREREANRVGPVRRARRVETDARAADSAMPDMTPSHLLMVYYASGRGIFWHKDDAPNDGQNDHPVVSFSLGNACTFGLCHAWSWQRGKEHARKVELQSGDALLFGGPCRYIHHSVLGVRRQSAPAALVPLLGGARLNLTYRDAPAVAGLEQTTYRFFTPPDSQRRARKRRAGAEDAPLELPTTTTRTGSGRPIGETIMERNTQDVGREE